MPSTIDTNKYFQTDFNAGMPKGLINTPLANTTNLPQQVNQTKAVNQSAVSQPQATNTTDPGQIRFLDNSVYTSQGKQISPPKATISSTLAQEQTKDNINKLAGVSMGTNQTQNKQTPVDTSSLQPKDGAVNIDGISEELQNNPLFKGLVSLTNTTLTSLDDSLAKKTSLLDTYKEKLSTELQTTIDSIKASMAKRRDDMTRLNKAIFSGTTQAGIMAGRNRYTPELENATLAKQEQEGLDRIAEIDAQEQLLISQAKSAVENKEYDLLNQQMTSYDNIQKEKQGLLFDMYKTTIALEKEASDRLRQKEQDAIAKQREFNDFAKQHDLYKPFYSYDGGMEVFDSATGAKLTKAQYEAISKTKDLKDIQILGPSETTSKANTYVGKIGEYTDKYGRKQDIYGTYDYTTGQASPFNKNIADLPGAESFNIGPSVSGIDIVDRYNSVLKAFPLKVRSEVETDVLDYLSKGQVPLARELIEVKAVENLMPSSEKSAYLENQAMVDRFKVLRDNLAEFYRDGGTTDLLTSTAEDIVRKFGTTRGTKLAKLTRDMNELFYRVRQDFTGAAFSPAESADYKKLMPDNMNIKELNLAIIDQAMASLDVNRKSKLRTILGRTAYDTTFGSRDAELKLADILKSTPDLRSNIDSLYNEGLTADEILQVLPGSSVETFEPVSPESLPGLQMITPSSNQKIPPGLNVSINNPRGVGVGVSSQTSQGTSQNYTPLQKTNLTAAPELPPIKVDIGAGAGLKNNNPGNMRNKDGSWMKFNTPVEGFKALVGYIERVKKGDHSAYRKYGVPTIAQFFATYAPKADNNDPDLYAQQVAKWVGASPNSKITNIDSIKFAEAIARKDSSTKVTYL